MASLENCNETSAEFFCPVKMCFEFSCEANFRFSFRYCPKWDFFCEILFDNALISCCRKATIPEYKREYEEIEIRFDMLGFLCMYIEFDGVNDFEKRRMFAPCSNSIDVSNIWKWILIGRPKINAEVTTKGPSLLQGLQHLDAYLGYFCTSVN